MCFRPESNVFSPAGLQHSVPGPGPVAQLCGIRGKGGEDPERRQRVGQLPHSGLPQLSQEAHDRLAGLYIRMSSAETSSAAALALEHQQYVTRTFMFFIYNGSHLPVCFPGLLHH